jgi:hypothetical protein
MFALRSIVAIVVTAASAFVAVPSGVAVGASSGAVQSITDAAFTDVACPTAKHCVAVGYRNGAPMARRWNGRAWHSQTTPHRHGALSSVWCTGKANCLAVGHRTSGTTTRALAERWNGHRWQAVAAPDPPNSTSTSLESITCRSARDCVSTGSYSDNGNPRRTLAEAWNGTSWTIVASANPRVRVTGNDLSAVACRPVKCLAVGTRGRGTVGSRPLAESSAGGSWQVDAMADPGGTQVDSALSGTSCSATSHAVCMAVGNRNSGGATRPLAEKWVGGGWHRSYPLRRTGDHGDQLADVACTSASRCLAVGSAGTGGTITETWNEHGWTITPSARFANRYNGLESISCASANRCLAVGFDEKPDDSVHPLAEQWNGSAWRLVH